MGAREWFTSRELEMMKSSKPKTRSAATKPADFQKLSTSEQQAMEAGGEAEHAVGKRREELLREAKHATGAKPERGS